MIIFTLFVHPSPQSLALTLQPHPGDRTSLLGVYPYRFNYIKSIENENMVAADFFLF